MTKLRNRTTNTLRSSSNDCGRWTWNWTERKSIKGRRMFPIWVTFDVPRCGRRSQESVPYNSDGGSDRCNGIETFLGMVDELAIFLPHLSQDYEILRQLHRKDIEWSWLPNDQKAFEKIKMKLTEAPLATMIPTVNLQSSVMLHNTDWEQRWCKGGHPIAYASRALSEAESRYAQNEKELLAIVFACEKFETYVYGRQVTIDIDHKPLEMIRKKPIHTGPKR